VSVIVMVGPASPFSSGLSLRATSAVMTFVTLAAGIACSLPELAMKPRPETPTAAEPRAGQGRAGVAPWTTSALGSRAVAATAGIGRKY